MEEKKKSGQQSQINKKIDEGLKRFSLSVKRCAA
jgi:hypothetical protein